MNRLLTVALQFYTWMPPALLGTLAAAGCASDPRPAVSTATLFASLAPEPSTFVIDASVGGTIEGNGTSFNIPGGAIFLPGGAPADLDTDGDGVPDSHRVRGTVQVTLRELLSAEDMALADRPTVTSAGELLETGGAFELGISVGDTALQVTELHHLQITPANEPSSTDGMEVWFADDTAPGEFGWDLPPGGSIAAEPVGTSFVVPIIPLSYTELPVAPLVHTNVTAVPLVYRPPVIMINIDKRILTNGTSLAPRSSVSVRFTNNEPDDAAVFFFPAGLESVVRFQRDAAGGYVAPAGVMHADLAGRLVAVSVSDGRYFLEEREVSLASGRSFVVDPIEVTEAKLRDRLRAR